MPGPRSIIRRTTCTRDCPDACAIQATVDDGRVTALRGDPAHPVTRGFLCFRTSRFLERQYGADRLTQPLLRQPGGELSPVPLDEALDFVAERLLAIRAESGPAAILHYRSGGSLGLLKSLADLFFERFGPCATKIGDICSGAGEAAQEADFGICDSNDLFDLRHSRHIVLWGKNPFVSNVHLVPLLREATANGARVWLVDPVRHQGESLASAYLQPRPGGDLDLALAVARVLFESDVGIDPRAAERCDNLAGFRALAMRRSVAAAAAAADVAPAEVRALAAAFADGPTAILVGWGMQRRRHGAAIVRALDALSAVSGNLFRRGGGCSFYFKRRAAFASPAAGTAPRRIREPLLGDDILAAREPPIRAVWVTAGNPVCMLPDSARVAAALDATELVVVVDPFLTETGRRATVVLPCPTLLEDRDLVGAYGHHWLGAVEEVVPPPAGVLHEVELLQALAARVGLGDALAGSVDQWRQRLLAPVAGHGIDLQKLRDGGAVRSPLAAEVLFEDGRVATASGRVQLLDRLPPRYSPPPGYPLWLCSNSTERSQASQWAGKGLGDHTFVRVHPAAAPPGCAAGDLVAIDSPHGRILARLELDPGQRTDVAIVPKGGHFDRGQAANALIAAVPTDLGLGAAYQDCSVRLSPA